MLQSLGLQRVGHNLTTEQQTAVRLSEVSTDNVLRAVSGALGLQPCGQRWCLHLHVLTDTQDVFERYRKL